MNSGLAAMSKTKLPLNVLAFCFPYAASELLNGFLGLRDCLAMMLVSIFMVLAGCK